MSGGMDTGGGDTKRTRKHSTKKRKPRKRVNIRMDMTPLVDVAFLLLTFFMLTTVFKKPQTMEISLPPDAKVQIELAASNLCTIMVDENKNIFCGVGLLDKTNLPEKVEFKNLPSFLVQKAKDNPRFAFLLKLDRKAKYHMMVDILDELNVGSTNQTLTKEIRDALNRFSILSLDDNDKKVLAMVTM